MSEQIKFSDLIDKSSFEVGSAEIARILKKITEEITEAAKAADGLSSTMGESLKSDISSLSGTSKTLASDMANVQKKMDEFKTTTTNTAKVLSDYEKENKKLKDELTKLNKELKEGTEVQNKSNKSKNEGALSAKGLAQSFLGVASGAALLYKGVQVLKEQFVLALKSTMDFEQAMKEVQAISRASAQDLSLLTDNANRLGATTEKTAGDIARLQKELAKLGFTTSEILASTDAIVDLSTATGEDLATSAVVAAATLRAFGLEAVEMGRVIDVMAGSFVRSGLDLEKFRESMKLVAPIATATGVDIETVTASLSKLADAGLSGSLAGTSLRNLLSSMADPSEKLVKLLGKLDGSLAGGVKSSADFTRALVVLKQSHIDLESAVKLVDVRARSAFFTLVDQAKVIEGLSEEYRDLNGEASKIAAVMRDTLTNDVAIADSAFDAARRNLVEQFVPALRAAAQETATFSEFIRFAIKDISGFFSGLDDGEKSMINMALGVTQLKFVFGGLSKVYQNYVKEGKFKELKEGMQTLGTSLNVVSKQASKELSIYETMVKRMGEGKQIAGIAWSLKNLGAGYTDLLEKLEGGADPDKLAGQLLARLEFNLKSAKSSLDTQVNSLTQSRRELEVLQEISKSDGLTEDQGKRERFLEVQISLLEDIVKANSKVTGELELQIGKKEDLSKFDKDLLINPNENKKILKQTNKVLDETIKLEQQLRMEKMKTELDLLELKEKTETSPTRKSKLMVDIAKQELAISLQSYNDQLQIIDELYDKDTDSLIRREIKFEEYASSVHKTLGKLQIDQTKIEADALKQIEKDIEEFSKSVTKGVEKHFDDIHKQEEKNKEEGIELAEEEAEEREKIAEASAKALASITQGLFDNRQIKRDEEMASINAWEDEKLMLAGDNEEAKVAIEREAEMRRREIRIKQAKDNKAEAMFNIVIATALNIVKAFKNPIEMILAGALGAVQLAVVASRPIPQFEKGTTFSPEGLAEVGERGRELIVDGKSGQMRMANNRQHTYLSKGSVVVPNAQTEELLRGKNVDYNSIAFEALSRASQTQRSVQIDYVKMGDAFVKGASSIPQSQTTFDGDGVRNYIKKGNTRVERLNKRYKYGN